MVVCVRSRGKCFGCGEEGHYVAQCLKVSTCLYSVEEVPCVSIAESWVTRHHCVQN